MKRRGGSSLGNLAQEMAGLPDLDVSELRAQWQALYGSEPPRRIRRQILEGAIAYRLQERVYGGLKPATRRWLAAAANTGEGGTAPKRRSTTSATPGTRFLREWQGVTHEVQMMDDGVLYRGQRYRSLSEVARLITGARWSGPRFFGLKSSGAERPNETR